MTKNYSKSVELLRNNGLRPTRQRIALAKLLFERGDRHVTAEQLSEEAVAESIRVSLATVYNTLHQFTAAGLLREVVVDSSRSYFDTNVTDHHHFYFEDSGELQDIGRESVSISNLPSPPDGTRIRSIDVIVRVEGDQGD